MPTWKTDAVKRLAELVEEGRQPEDAVEDVVDEFASNIRWDAEETLLRSLSKKQKDSWAEPEPLDQLRFDLGGHEISISDAPVRYVDEDGDERFKPARHSTAIEREDSIAARIQHHLSWVTRSEAEHSRERTQNALMIELGVDLSKTWDEIRHSDTVCWRCLEGWRPGDPFERGHCDRPESQGGVQVAWEHRSCNRSAQDNPVANPDEITDESF